jgi:hypothetical protein
MRSVFRHPLLGVFLIGCVNIPVWYGFTFWGMDWRPSVLALIGLAFLSGWCTRYKAWGTLLVMLAPTMFVGSERHGRPWMWLAYGFLHPLLWIYFLTNMVTIICVYCVLIYAGHAANRRFQRSRLRRE